MKIIFFLFIIFHFSALGQEGVTYHQDSKIDLLIQQQSVSNLQGNTILNGFRIQLNFDETRQTIEDERNRFLALYPEIPAYVTFNAPNFYLKVGDYRSTLDAESDKVKLIQQFPSAFVLKEKINLPKLN